MKLLQIENMECILRGKTLIVQTADFDRLNNLNEKDLKDFINKNNLNNVQKMQAYTNQEDHLKVVSKIKKDIEKKIYDKKVFYFKKHINNNHELFMLINENYVDLEIFIENLIDFYVDIENRDIKKLDIVKDFYELV